MIPATRLLSALLASLMLAACTQGVAEFRYFDEAYRAQAESGEAALDRLAASERALWERDYEKRKTDPDAGGAAAIPDFDPDEAALILEVGEPPLTAAIRDSLRSVTRFNDAMTGLATGEAGEALAARMGDAVTSVTGAAGAFGAASGLPQGTVFAGAAKGAVELVKPFFTQLAQIEDRAQFQKILIDAYPSVRKMMVELRGGTVAMFDVHREAYKDPDLVLGGVDGVPKDRLPALEEERRRLAEWVLLLDQAMIAMDEAVAAIKEGRSASTASLVAASQELSRLAETVKILRNRN